MLDSRARIPYYGVMKNEASTTRKNEIEEYLLENGLRRAVYATFETRLLNRTVPPADAFSVKEIRLAIRRLRNRGQLIVATPMTPSYYGSTEAGYRRPYGVTS